ncbi:hypothetical protein U1E44_01710 [Arenibacter sp. GZD96]|uniref:hypothetical protein n=1 Tax=Aurantibrevibacter litoralis TaxID=3106030 RepID=UPI002AFE1B56|nr:hypothetical protein [Arenibacter sp. GZD-96]MEA1784795.1 hypothetical protein [Arenibacter sp. GZD-96]
MRAMLQAIFQKSVIRRSLKTSMFVGIILSLINCWEPLVALDVQQIPWLKIIMNFMVPYLVASFSIVGSDKNRKTEV